MPMIDLLAISAIDRDTEISYIHRERDWAGAGARRRGPLPATPAGCCRSLPGERARQRQRPRRQRQRPCHGGNGQRRPLMHVQRRVGGPGAPLDHPVPQLGWDDLLFLVLAGDLLGRALLVVLGRNIIRSGLWMILCFAALAGIYALARRSRSWPARRCSSTSAPSAC